MLAKAHWLFQISDGWYIVKMPGSDAPVYNHGHARIDARSLAMHRAIAAKLIANPGLLAIAHDNLKRWATNAGRSQPYSDAWAELLTKPLHELVALMQEDSEFMRAMRQCSPFAGVLLAKERWEIYDAFAVGAADSSRRDHRQ